MTGRDRCRGDGFLRLVGLAVLAIAAAFVVAVIAKATGLA